VRLVPRRARIPCPRWECRERAVTAAWRWAWWPQRTVGNETKRGDSSRMPTRVGGTEGRRTLRAEGRLARKNSGARATIRRIFSIGRRAALARGSLEERRSGRGTATSFSFFGLLYRPLP